MVARSLAGTAVYGLSWLLFAGVLGQFFLAGAGAFGAASFDAHAGAGVLLVLVALLLLVLVARTLRRPVLLLSGALFLQLLLGGLGRDQEAWIGAFHALNAVVVLGLSYSLARAAGVARAEASGLVLADQRKEPHVPDSVTP